MGKDLSEDEHEINVDEESLQKKKKKKKHKNKEKGDEIVAEEKINDLPSNLIKSNDTKENENFTPNDKTQHEISNLEIKRGETTNDYNELTENVPETTLQPRDKQVVETAAEEHTITEMKASNDKRKYKEKNENVNRNSV